MSDTPEKKLGLTFTCPRCGSIHQIEIPKNSIAILALHPRPFDELDAQTHPSEQVGKRYYRTYHCAACGAVIRHHMVKGGTATYWGLDVFEVVEEHP